MRRKTRPIRIRWTFNYGRGELSRGTIGHRFAGNLMEDVAIAAAEDMWKTIRDELQTRITRDVFREISRMASLYKQLIIGLSGANTGRTAELRAAAQPAPGMRSFTRWPLHVNWQPRSDRYLRRKRKGPPRGVGHNRWFEHSGLLGRRMGRAKTWTEAFGPISISISRTSMARGRNRGGRWLDTGRGQPSGSDIRAHIAKIRVGAFGNITPSMLPALATGDIDDMAPDGRKTGLIGRFPREIAYGLAGSAQTKNFVPYRHTIEPFLGFVLTRAIPNAVAKRLHAGLGAKADIRADRRSRDDRFEGRMW